MRLAAPEPGCRKSLVSATASSSAHVGGSFAMQPGSLLPLRRRKTRVAMARAES